MPSSPQNQLSKAEQQQLSSVLRLSSANGYRIVAASVVAVSGEYADTVTINAGRSDGITANETVLNGDGLVGTVTAASATTATVQLATDASSTVGVKTADTGRIGALSGTGGTLSASGDMQLKLFSSTAVLHPGETLVTYGSVGGRPYAPGVPVGQVLSVTSQPGSLNPVRRGQPVRRLHRARGGRRGGQPMTAARKVIRALAVPVALLIAVIVQLTIVNRAPLPGRGAPDLVLLVVAAPEAEIGAVVGALAGFAGGLALDIAPPSGHLAGEYALVFCLVGYVCGRISAAVEDATGERQAVTSLTLVALEGVAAGEAGKAALGMMVSDPNVTGPAIKHVLPGAILR